MNYKKKIIYRFFDFQHENVLSDFCPKVVCEYEMKNSNYRMDLCLSWLDIAFNHCLHLAFPKPDDSGEIWKSIFGFVIKIFHHQNLPFEVEAQYSDYIQKPNSLSSNECSDLYQKIFSDFANFHNGNEIHSKSTNPMNNEISINDFVWTMNIILLFTICAMAFYWRQEFSRNFKGRLDGEFTEANAKELFESDQEAVEKKFVDDIFIEEADGDDLLDGPLHVINDESGIMNIDDSLFQRRDLEDHVLANDSAKISHEFSKNFLKINMKKIKMYSKKINSDIESSSCESSCQSSISKPSKSHSAIPIRSRTEPTMKIPK